MKRHFRMILLAVMICTILLCSSASANSWNLKGKLLLAMIKTHDWDDYILLGNQADPFAVMSARYHKKRAVLIALLLLGWLVSSFLVNPFLFPFLIVNIYVVWGLIAYFALKIGFVKHTHPLVPELPAGVEQDHDQLEDGDRKP